jgi:hypothetical protein
MTRYRLRLAFNALVAHVPRWMLKGFFKTFLTCPEVAEAAGFHVFPRVFDSPITVPEEIDWQQLNSRRELPGIDFHEIEALQLVAELARFASELDVVPYERSGPNDTFWFNNASFTDFDAAALYAMLRYRKPKRYVELGCGFSSYVSSRALARNASEGAACGAIYADPEPRRDLIDSLVTGRVLSERVQELPLHLFTQLEKGDVLFIDTSHVLKVQSDVVVELVRILPSLAAGVWIHFHDVYSPYDYPEDWVRMPVRPAANEQYGVECLLSGGDRYRVLLPLYLLWKEQRPELQKLFPRGQTRPQSFWIQKQC